jgi:hypothetical protein
MLVAPSPTATESDYSVKGSKKLGFVSPIYLKLKIRKKKNSSFSGVLGLSVFSKCKSSAALFWKGAPQIGCK